MFAYLCDIHLGTKLPHIDYMKSLNEFLNIIKNHKEECHCIFVCGDLFDHKLNIDELSFASKFLFVLVNNGCGRTTKNVPVHFLHGTYSHDYGQYDIFMPLLKSISSDVYYTLKKNVNILPHGEKVLYLPQEYGIVDYQSLFEDKYDIIVGHGVISSAIKRVCPCGNNDIEIPIEILGKISKICVFGHYHQYTEFDNNVFYAGSMLRWMYGEDETKYFILSNDNYEIEKYKNPFAKEFKTIKVSSPEELREAISNNKNIDTPTRFFINTISINNDTEMNIYKSIIDTNKKNTNLSFKMIINDIVDINATSDDNNDNETVNDNDLSTNDNLVIKYEEPVPALIQYIKDKYNVDLSTIINEYQTKLNQE